MPRKAEGRYLARHAFVANVDFVFFTDRPYDAKPDAEAALAWVKARETLKNFVARFLVDPLAAVWDLKMSRTELYAHEPACVGVFYGIAEKIIDEARNFIAVGYYRRLA